MSYPRLSARVGDVSLRSPIMTAAGTAGYGTELADYGDVSQLGAIVTKSLAAFSWAGNPSPRVAPAGDAMLNSVGLAGPGVAAWRESEWPSLRDSGASVVASVWGRSAREFGDAVSDLAGLALTAIEINASCPNLEGRRGMFAHSAPLIRELLEATSSSSVPRWVKLSPNTPDLVEIATAAVDGAADALVIANTLLGMDIDISTGRPTLGNGGGGVSGFPIFPVALRCVYEVRAALPDVPIVGVGGVSSVRDVVAMLMAGASAVEVGTAGFADPRIYWRLTRGLNQWMSRQGFDALADIVNLSHRGGR
jgi:dihydroorotate dehydrogenase (NAD+) catalytic subunit